MKHWMIASSIAAGVVVISVILVYYSIPVNPCSLALFQNADAILAPTTTKELYDNAEVVVLGKITDSSARCEGTQIWTHMQVQVEEYLKNPQESRILTAKSIGGTIGNYGYWMEDSPIYSREDRVLLFLYKQDTEDKIYRISYPTGVIQDPGLSGTDLLRGFAIKSQNDTIALAKGADALALISLESFFGYDSPTNLTISSFTYYNSTTQESFYSANVTALSEFGIAMDPASAVITPPANGTAKTEVKISASNTAIQGVYDISIYAVEKDGTINTIPNIGYTFVRVNVTDGEDHSRGETPAKILTAEGITLGAPYIVQVSWDLFETLQGNGMDLSVLIKDKETMEPLEQVTYDFGYKGVAELGGFQDRYVEDFSNPHKFRTGIKNPCDMHLTIFIDRVGDLSFENMDLDTSSVLIQFRTFPENESEECDSNNVKLSLFNGYDHSGNRVPSETDYTE
ncbi:MAG: hypothetical protein ACREBU_01745 [Nitrososphaera sp.]